MKTGEISENGIDRTEEALSEQELRLLVDNMINPFSYYHMIYNAEGKVIDYVFLAVNRAFERETGVTREAIIGKSVLSVYPKTEQYWMDFLGRVAKTGEPGLLSEYSAALQKWYSLYAYSPKQEYVAITVNDNTSLVAQKTSLKETVQELAEQKEENYRLAHEEPISGLPNRACLYEAFEARIAVSHMTRFFVAIITPDNLAEILGAYGSVLSDRVMRSIAKRLEKHFPLPDQFFSMTGTDLVLLVSSNCSALQIRKHLTRVMEDICLPVEIDGANYYVSASCGVACYPADGETSEALIMKANLALYQAKREKRAVAFFSEKIAASLLRRSRIRNALPKALENCEFELYFQPQIHSFSSRLLGFEALLRWHSPDLGEVSPLEFIGVAEESRLILPLGAWVLRNACATLATLNRKYQTKYFMAVNVSGIQLFVEGFVEAVLAVLAETDLAPERLELEITESVLLSHERSTIQKLNTLYGHGVRIALDDFGTGFSSLSLLKDIKITTLKIDKSFVQDGKNSALLEMMVRLGHILGTQTVAEGVETEEQMNQARRLGSERVQGYFTARPMPLPALKRFIEAHTV